MADAVVGSTNGNEFSGAKRKSSAEMMYCNVCKIFLNSALQADAHFAGKSHKNKTKRENVEGYTPTEILTSPPVKSNPQLYECEICKKFFNSALQLTDHTHGKSHQFMAQRKLENNPVTSNTGSLISGILTPGTMSPGIMTPGTVENCGTIHFLKQNITNSGFINPGSLNQESVIPEPPQGDDNQSLNVGKNLITHLFRCENCNITLNSKKQLDQHNNGLRHKIIIGQARPPAVSGEKWENVRFMKISNAILGINKDTATGSGGGMNIHQYHCEKCNITVNSQMQLDQHLESNKHKMKGTEQPNNNKNKLKRPFPKGQESGQNMPLNDKRPYPGPLTNNFVHSNTYIHAGGGKPVYRLPPHPRQYTPQNTVLQS